MAIVPLINTASIETFYIDFRDEAHGSYIIDTAAQEDSVRNDTRLDTVLTYAEGAPASTIRISICPAGLYFREQPNFNFLYTD